MRSGDGETRGRGEFSGAWRRFSRRVSPSPRLRVMFLLLAAHCSLLTASAQPGMPQPNSPLYGARPATGQVATGLPNALKKVGIDQKLNEQIPLDAVFKDEQGREVKLNEFFGTAKLVATTWPVPRAPRRAPGHAKNVIAVPGRPVRSP